MVDKASSIRSVEFEVCHGVFGSHLCGLIFPGGLDGKVSAWAWKIFWRRKWKPTPVSLPGEIPWTEEPGGLQSVGSQGVGHG